MIKKLMKYLLKPVLSSEFRYSKKFMGFQTVFSYSAPENMMQIAFDLVARVFSLEGDYLEFGVYKGTSFVSAFYLAQSRNLKSMRFYAFDSFRGLPGIRGVDDSVANPYKEGQYACDIDKFKKIISGKGVDLRKVTLIPGWYEDTLNDRTRKKLPIKKASIIWIDCDLYESTVPVLNFITDYIQDGTIIIFDDWFSFRGDPDKGEQRAFREWLGKNPSIEATEFHRFAAGKSFIMKVKKK